MTHTIHRYTLDIVEQPTVRIPGRAQVLSVGPPRGQGDHINLWALVNPNHIFDETRRFRIVGTGQPVPKDVGRFIGTVPTRTGDVWHVFEAKAGSR